ncbi:MAG: hypothetical protein ABEJ75_03150 [Candidatus Nanohaloarchaea archaeon]
MRKGQFMVLTAMIVSVMVIGTVATISQIQSKSYSPDDQAYYINRIQREAQKVTAQQDKEIENFKRMVNSLTQYTGRAKYWSRTGQRDCFNVTLTKPGVRLHMTCVEVGAPA